jgi:glycosyltransferase involved in cell wall biosynthesis
MFNPRKINILQLVNGFAIGGAERKLLDLVRSLDRNKYRIVICSVGQGGPLQKEFEKLGLKVVVLPKKFAFDFSLIFKVARLMRKERIEIVQTTLLYADLIGALAAKLAGVPIVISWETVSHGTNDSLRTKSRHKLGYRFAMKFVDRIVAVSDETRMSIIDKRKVFPEKVMTIHYGVDLNKYKQSNGFVDRKKLGIPEDAPIVGVVARLEEIKGHHYFIRAASEIINKFPKVNCVLVGDGSLRESLEKEVKKLGLESNFHFLGFRNDIQNLLNVFDIFVLPSISEGLPNVILEAMACKKPVVATSVGGIPEAVVHGITGFLVPVKNPASMAQAVVRLLENKKFLIEMGQKGRQRVEEEYSLDKEISEFENLYDTTFKQKIAKGNGFRGIY